MKRNIITVGGASFVILRDGDEVQIRIHSKPTADGTIELRPTKEQLSTLADALKIVSGKREAAW